MATNILEEEEFIISRNAKAKALLLSWLTPEQKEQLLEKNYFEAEGCYSKTKFRITLCSMFNVEHEERLTPSGGLFIQRYCSVLDVSHGAEVMCDRMLAQKIAIETDELKFLGVCNAQSVLNRFIPIPEPEPEPEMQRAADVPF